MIADKSEMTLWVKTYTADLLAYTTTRISDKVAAEDLVQDTFLAAMEASRSFERQSNPKTWLLSILKRKIADYYRRQYKQVHYQFVHPADELFDEHGRMITPCASARWDMDEDLLDDQNFLRVLRTCLEALPPKWSSVVELKYLDGTDSRTVCQKLEITPSNFWQIMHRAKLQLKSCLEKKWFGASKAA